MSIDLKELGKRVDEALLKETPDSWAKWLNECRQEVEQKKVLEELEQIEKWLNRLGRAWNYFGDVDRAKQHLKNAMFLIENMNP